MSGPLPPRQGLVAFMATLAGREPAGFLELRHRRRDGTGMHQRFFDAATPQAASMAATVLAQTGEVYVGCCPRSRRVGGKDAIDRGWTLWVDCDDPQAIAALERFHPQPAIVVRTSARGLHAYWPLQRALAARQLERANLRLAHALGACQSAVTNAAAILRPPATRSWKYDPPVPVTLERYTGERFDADADGVAGALGRPRSPRSRRAGTRSDDPLLAIEPAVYLEALTGRRVGRDGKVACPFHPDERPSLHAYPDPARGGACYSARCWRGERPNGGDIYELAGQLFGLPQQTDYVRLRRRLYELFLPGVEPQPPRRRAGSAPT
jgi:hypothetical protein